MKVEFLKFANYLNYKKIIVALFINMLLFSPAIADEKSLEMDNIRAELSFLKNKNSPDYVKLKQKLDKYIKKNNINYTNEARLIDVQRLLEEKKYNSAIYELNELIENSYEVSKCNEILGDISVICAKPVKKIAQYYKIALQHDLSNHSALLKLVKLYIQEKKNILAIECLKQIIDTTQDGQLLSYLENLIQTSIEPQNKFEANNLYELLGNIYEKSGHLENAYIAYTKAIQLNSQDVYLKYHLANLFFENDKNDDAIMLYNSILTDNLQDFQIKNSIAKSFIKKGNLLSAAQNYQEILKRFPNSSQAKYGMYKIFENKLTPDKILSKIHFDNTSYFPTQQDLLTFADFLNDMGEFQGANAFKSYAQNLVKANEEIKTNTKKEIAENRNDKKVEKVVENKKNESKKNIKEKTEKTKIKNEQQALKQKEVNKFLKKKEQVVQKQEKKDDIPKEVQKNKIELEKEKTTLKDDNKYEELNSIIEKYLKIEPKTAQIYIGISNTYKQMGMKNNALNALEKAKKLEPTNSDVYYNIGLIKFENNQTQDAKINLVKAINLDNENVKAKNLLSFVNQRIITQAINGAYSKYEEKKYVQSFEILENALKEYPQNAQLYYYRALIFAAMNRNAAAIYDLQKSIEFDPSYYMAYYELGKMYEKIDDERNALVAYERFLSIEPDEKELISEIQKKVIELGKKYY